jgi:hypothetical protein
MPICRTCRGEYGQREATCPSCGTPVGDDIDHCRRCSADTSKGRQCPRCKGDVSTWEHEDITLWEFILLEGGILGLMPGAMALFAWVFFWTPRETSAFYYPVMTAASFGLSLFVFFGLYVKRLFWWERWWASQVYQVKAVPLVAAITLSGLMGVFLSVLWVFLYAAWGKPESMLRKGMFMLVYVPSYVFLTIALTLMFVHGYISRLERSVPQPIFMNTKRLLMVIVDSVSESVNLEFKYNARQSSARVEKPSYEVLEAVRIPENGGINVLLRECKRVRHPDNRGQMHDEWMEMLWRIQGDRWGRVQSIQPGSLEPFTQEKRVFRVYGRYS